MTINCLYADRDVGVTRLYTYFFIYIGAFIKVRYV